MCNLSNYPNDSSAQTRNMRLSGTMAYTHTEFANDVITMIIEITNI